MDYQPDPRVKALLRLTDSDTGDELLVAPDEISYLRLRRTGKAAQVVTKSNGMLLVSETRDDILDEWFRCYEAARSDFGPPQDGGE
jgi:hypothetical protein